MPKTRNSFLLQFVARLLLRLLFFFLLLLLLFSVVLVSNWNEFSQLHEDLIFIFARKKTCLVVGEWVFFVLAPRQFMFAHFQFGSLVVQCVIFVAWISIPVNKEKCNEKNRISFGLNFKSSLCAICTNDNEINSLTLFCSQKHSTWAANIKPYYSRLINHSF